MSIIPPGSHALTHILYLISSLTPRPQPPSSQPGNIKGGGAWAQSQLGGPTIWSAFYTSVVSVTTSGHSEKVQSMQRLAVGPPTPPPPLHHHTHTTNTHHTHMHIHTCTHTSLHQVTNSHGCRQRPRKS